MPIRNTWRSGDHLAVCDEAGTTHYASEMARDWDGSWRHKDNLDGRHPQLDVKARRDPAALVDIRPKATSEVPGFKILLESANTTGDTDREDALIQETGVQYILTES